MSRVSKSLFIALLAAAAALVWLGIRERSRQATIRGLQGAVSIAKASDAQRQQEATQVKGELAELRPKLQALEAEAELRRKAWEAKKHLPLPQPPEKPAEALAAAGVTTPLPPQELAIVSRWQTDSEAMPLVQARLQAAEDYADTQARENQALKLQASMQDALRAHLEGQAADRQRQMDLVSRELALQVKQTQSAELKGWIRTGGAALLSYLVGRHL